MRGQFSKAVILGGLILANAAYADVIQFSGLFTQSTLDGTGPAANNLSLNLIQDGDPFTVTLTFSGSITTTSPVPYDLTGASLILSDLAQAASESSFDTISLTVAADGAFADFSLFACLTTGSGCAVGNQLTANFQIPVALLNAQNVGATGLDQPHPLDLLEDDGTTDIHGSIDRFSYTGATIGSVPEPSAMAALSCALAVFGLIGKNRRRK
jgi:hypothetical protein